MDLQFSYSPTSRLCTGQTQHHETGRDRLDIADSIETAVQLGEACSSLPKGSVLLGILTGCLGKDVSMPL